MATPPKVPMKRSPGPTRTMPGEKPKGSAPAKRKLPVMPAPTVKKSATGPRTLPRPGIGGGSLPVKGAGTGGKRRLPVMPKR